MAQTQRVRGVATTIYTENGETVVRYHQTAVVRFSKDSITLNSGGWRTNTTKTRMNQAANQFGLGYQVVQDRGNWYVCMDDADGNEVRRDFTDGMTFPR